MGHPDKFEQLHQDLRTRSNEEHPSYAANYKFVEVEKAKQLLAEAGYKDGEGFPTLKLYNSGKESQALRVGLEIQKELRTSLNINVEIVSVSFAEKIAAEAKGEAHMSIAAWLSDFPTPDNFLSIAYGATVPSSMEESSYPNASRYTNKEFDK